MLPVLAKIDALKKIVDYGMTKHVGLIVKGNLIATYPEEFELFRNVASNIYTLHTKISKSIGNYIFLEIYVKDKRIIAYPLDDTSIILLHLNEDVSVELVLDEVLKLFGKAIKGR